MTLGITYTMTTESHHGFYRNHHHLLSTSSHDPLGITASWLRINVPPSESHPETSLRNHNIQKRIRNQNKNWDVSSIGITFWNRKQRIYEPVLLNRRTTTTNITIVFNRINIREINSRVSWVWWSNLEAIFSSAVPDNDCCVSVLISCAVVWDVVRWGSFPFTSIAGSNNGHRAIYNISRWSSTYSYGRLHGRNSHGNYVEICDSHW